MKGFLDTSVLVPVFYGNHLHHRASLDLFVPFDKCAGCCGAHSLAEIWNVRHYSLCAPEVTRRQRTP